MPSPIVTPSGWFPPRGAVSLAGATDPKTGERGWLARCSCCGWQAAGGVKAAVADEKRFHRCPPGTEGAVPMCPDCGSTAKRCRWDDDPGCVYWHPHRVASYSAGFRARRAEA